MKELICIVCPRGCHLQVDENNNYEVTGNRCQRGEAYGKQELISPQRVVTSTVVLTQATEHRCPVRTAASVPKDKMQDVMEVIRCLEVKAPVKMGQVLYQNIAQTGVDLIATRSIPAKD